MKTEWLVSIKKWLSYFEVGTHKRERFRFFGDMSYVIRGMLRDFFNTRFLKK